MKIKRFEGRDMQDVLQQVKAEMGEEAVLLHTRSAKEGLLGSLLGKSRMEAWAAVDTVGTSDQLPEESSLRRGLNLAGDASQPGGGTSSEILTQASTRSRPASVEPGRADPSAARVTPLSGWRMGFEVHPAQPHAESLMRCGVDAVAAWEIAWAAAKSPEDPERFLDECFRTVANGNSPPGFTELLKGSTVALVGPTGAGKTTTIAKLAARCVLDGTRRVALMSVDTYRIAAVEQLRTYARIMDVPLLVTETPQEAERQIQQARKEYDLILIDTIGRSQRNRDHLQGLREIVAACNPAEVHLVLPAVTSLADLLEAVEQFAALSVNRFLFTKLDETKQPGVLASIGWRYATPVSFLTTGQSVPEDIEVATRRRLTEFVYAPVNPLEGVQSA